MPLEIPNLDDRSWADLVEEARSLIPRFAPRWTDHNAHDPGMTFIEMFAWLAEMQIYQLNRVGQKQKELFGRLAGVSRNPRKPARVDIQVDGDLKAGTFVEAGRQLTPLEGTEIVFETETDLFLTRSRLVKVIANDGSNSVDHSSANQKPGIAFLAFGENAQAGAELRLGFDAFYPHDEREFRITARVFNDDLVGPCGPGDPSRPAYDQTTAPVELVWEYQVAGNKWVQVKDLRDETGAFSHSGAITFAVPTDAVPELGRYWIRSRISRGYYDIEPRLRSISVNVLPCSQKETVRDEVLNPVTGKPDQSFQLARARAKKPILVPEQSTRPSITSNDVADWELLAKQLDASHPALAARLHRNLETSSTNSLSAFERIKELNLELAGSISLRPQAKTPTSKTDDEVSHLLGRTPVVVAVDREPWHPVTTFESSDPKSKHYRFDVESGRVEFGNGLNGQVPKPDQDVRAIWYQVSSGRSGNVAKGLQWRFRNAGVAGVTLTNPEPATGGTDLEPLEEMELRARSQLNRPERTVTLSDMELLALSTPNVYVARAKAIPNCPVPESITVVAVPKVRPGRKGPPNPPSERFLQSVGRHLQQRRLLCDNLRVTGPIYIEVRVSARLRLPKGAGPTVVLDRARQELDRFLRGELQPVDQKLAPSRDSVRRNSTESPCPTRWPFGRWVFPSEVYAILDGVAGVDFASDLVLSASRDGKPVKVDKTGAIPVPQAGLVYAGLHDLTVESNTRRNG